MKKIIFVLILLQFFFLYNFSNAQLLDCTSKTFIGSHLETQYPQTFPDYSLEMPYEVLLGYIALDTVCYNGNINEFNEFLNRMEYNDTLKTIMKHYYLTSDWDPIKFFQSRLFKDTAMKIPTYTIIESINEKIREKSEHPFLDYVLCNNDIIAHIKVNDTISWVDNNESDYSWAKYGATVVCEIIEPIKGKIIPDFNSNNKNISSNPEVQGITTAENGKVLIFDYCYNWQRKGQNGEYLNMKDSTGAAWIKKDKEYIVFLKLTAKCVDSNNIVFYLRPVDFNESSTGFLYPIENGYVVSPLDDLGIGTGLTVTEFKNAIKNRINKISNYSAE